MTKEIHIRTMREDMERTGLELPRLWPIVVRDRRPGDLRGWVLPRLDHIEAISTLWIVLQQIVDDWKGYSNEISFSDFGPSAPRHEFSMYAFQELEPRFINCLFSYITFFFLLENGFRVIFSEMNQTARELSISINVPERPKRSPYLQRLKLVRDHTVAHWGGPEKREAADSRAGRAWGLSFPAEADTVEGITFGHTSADGQDRHLETLAQTHAECVEYLRQFDVACASMLSEIIQFLPIRKGTREYTYGDPALRAV